MRLFRWGLRLVLCVGGLAMVLSAPAAAQPSDNPCTLAVSFVCRFVPIVPDLDGDVDLTQNQPTGGPLLLDGAAPADPCSNECN